MAASHYARVFAGGGALNTFDLQRAICDDMSLNGGEVAVLLALTTYLPTIAVGVESIARRSRLQPKSVRRILRRLDGRWIQRQLRPGKPTVYTFDPPLDNPPLEQPGVSEYQGAPKGIHPPPETPPEETNKRDTNNTPEDSRARLAAWAPVWREVIANGPLPSLDELRSVKRGVTEGVFSSCLGEVATSCAAGTVKSPRALFFARLKGSTDSATPWTQEQVLAALRPVAAPTSTPDLKRPALQAPTIEARKPETESERHQRRTEARASLAALGALFEGGDA